jgi:hypothetical protein
VIDALRDAVARAVVAGSDPRLAVERALRALRYPLRAPRVERAPGGGRAYRWTLPDAAVTLTVPTHGVPSVAVGQPPLTPVEVSHMHYRMNSSMFSALQSEVAGKASEKSQVNAVVAALAAQGYANAAHPEVSQTSVDRSTYRLYLWRDTPFGDHVVLATGPSFEPSLLLASKIPATPNTPGFFIHAQIAEGAVKTLSGAARAASRTASAAESKAKASESRAKADAKAAKEKAAREAERANEERARAAEAERRAAEAERRAAEERAEKERAKREAAEEKARSKKVAPAEDAQAKAIAQAQAFIAAIKAGKGK